ncbi:hypothetical protein D3C78_954420 [compost metagenome]
MILAEGRRRHLGETLQRGIQLFDLGRAGTLLRAEYRRRATRSAERVVDVRGDFDLHRQQPRFHATQVDLRQIGQYCTAIAQFVAGHIEKTHAECLQHSHPGIIGGAATETEDDLACPGLQRRADQLASAVAGGPGRVALALGDPVQAAGRGHLDHRRAIVQQPPVCGHRMAHQRATHPAFAAFARPGCQHGVHGALATVGQRPQDDLGSRHRTTPAIGNGGGGFRCGETFLEGVGGDDDLHSTTSRGVRVDPCGHFQHTPRQSAIGAGRSLAGRLISATAMRARRACPARRVGRGMAQGANRSRSHTPFSSR